MTEELEGKTPEAGPAEDKSVEGASPQGATYDGPLDKFKGKTVDEIAQSYAELEKMASKRDQDFKSAQDKLSAYEQYYQQQMMQQQRQQQVAQQQSPQTPQQAPDIYDNPQAFIQQTVNPIMDQRLEQMEFQSSLDYAPNAEFMAKQMYPDVFEGVDEGQLKNVMFGGVKSGGINHRALRDPNAWKMAAWQMKGDSMGYKQPSTPQPMEPTMGEAPAGKASRDEGGRMPQNYAEAAKFFGVPEDRARKYSKEAMKETGVDNE